MQRCCVGYLGGSREVCRGIAMCFALSCLFACLLLLGSGKFDYSLVPTLISFRRTVLPRVFSALSGFMPPKRTTRNSLSTYFDMASDPANSDLSPVSPGLPNSRCHLADEMNKFAAKSMPRVQHNYYFSSFNQSNHQFVTLSLSLSS